MTNRELAEALRLCASVYRCDECPYFKPGEPMTCIFTIKRDAADALANSETHIAALQKEIEKLRGQLEMERKPQWVSVKERMPERWIDPDTSELVNYLVYSPDFGIEVGNYYADAKYWVFVGVPTTHITHWAPLPEPPSTEGVE